MNFAFVVFLFNNTTFTMKTRERKDKKQVVIDEDGRLSPTTKILMDPNPS